MNLNHRDEIIFWIIISYVSGGINSPYLYIIVITIIYSGFILQKKGALFTAFFAIIILFLEALLLKLSYLPLISQDLVEFYLSSWKSVFMTLSSYLFFFMLTGFASSRIAKSFHRVNKDLEESERASKEMRKHFLNIFANIPIGILAVKDDKILYTNNYCEQFQDSIQKITRVFLNEIQIYKKWQEKRLDGKIFNFTIMPYIENQKVILFSDITEIKQREEDILKKDKMAAIGNLTASIAHEIKNPLTSLIGATEIMFSSFQSVDEDSQKLMEIISREGNRVKRLLDNLFNYTEQKNLNISKIKLKELILEIIKIFETNYPEVSFHINIDAPLFDGDSDRLREIFWNLFINSVEAMKSKGRIDVSTRFDNKNIYIFIQDEGGGIPEELIEKVFNPFFSTKKRGTGLGLAVVYKVIKAHRGTIAVSNTISGAEFRISLPQRHYPQP